MLSVQPADGQTAHHAVPLRASCKQQAGADQSPPSRTAAVAHPCASIKYSTAGAFTKAPYGLEAGDWLLTAGLGWALC